VSAGPFIVTGRKRVRLPEDRGDELGRERVLSRRAVADLDAARERVLEGCIARLDYDEHETSVLSALMTEAADLPAEGGTVHLPDGSDVEVEAVEPGRLASEAGIEPSAKYITTESLTEGRFTRDVLAAWNEKHGIEAQDERGSRG
jgi:hypothetical protein